MEVEVESNVKRPKFLFFFVCVCVCVFFTEFWNTLTMKLTFSPLKIGHPERKLVFQPPIFRGYVSFREGTCSVEKYWCPKKRTTEKQSRCVLSCHDSSRFLNSPEADPELPEIEEEVGETFFTQSLSDLVVSKIACSKTFATFFLLKASPPKWSYLWVTVSQMNWIFMSHETSGASDFNICGVSRSHSKPQNTALARPAASQRWCKWSKLLRRWKFPSIDSSLKKTGEYGGVIVKSCLFGCHVLRWCY